MALSDLAQAFQAFQQGVRDYSITQGVNEATQAVQQLNADTTLSLQQRASQQGQLANMLQAQMATAGASQAQIAAATGAIRPPMITNSAEAYAQAQRATNPADAEAYMKQAKDMQSFENAQANTARAETQAFQAEQNALNRETQLEIAGLRTNASTAQRAAKPTPGQETVDKTFAKEYDSWSSGGASRALTEIDKLDAVAKALEKRTVTTGFLTGVFPDRITSDKVLSARSDVQSSVMSSLRETLGAQFTEKEGERVIKNTWNEADSTENNLARINRLVSNLRADAEAKAAKAKYFEQNGTLVGYRGPEPTVGIARATPAPIDKTSASYQDTRQQAINWARANPNDPRAQQLRYKYGF